MALIVVRIGFAKTIAIALPPIPVESDDLGTIFLHLDYLNSLKWL